MRKPITGTLLMAALLAGATLLLGIAPAGAVTVSDEAGLRAAFADAAETQIDLANDITLVDCSAGGGDLERNSATALTINGNGFTITQTCAGERVMRQAGTGALTVDGITLTGGTDTGNGGGIDTDTAPITVTNSTISDNTAGGNGGGIAQTTGTITVTNSTISGNDAALNGGGIAQTSGTVTVTNSTISGNDGELNGGGIAQTSGTVTVTNSTISGNTAGLNGGGIAQTGGSVTLVYVTLVQNGATLGNNINGPGSDLSSFGSVVALAQAGAPNCGNLGSTTSNGFNFSDDATCGFTAGTDRQDAGDPGLGALADNGGPTPTQLPQTGSPLIDAIPATSCQADGASGITTDQRGVTRPQVGGCDIGAVEVEPAGPPAPAPAPGAAVPVAAVARFTG
ncbi:MAG: choice-of-anchor Q domain-containing protein [Acidimicrobiia bacterium]